ncbi:MAG TPA: sll0787 family AIR synthase-like protein [Polyangiaceae bacterium]|jgi:AIR synthase-related protein|nr:sll0787 family AIR synthase-like protein [Polyangiaceae bacterium]
MNLEGASFEALVVQLRARAELGYKQDIQLAAKAFGRETRSAWFPGGGPVVNGDDTAALADEHGEYVLFAAEGMRGELVAADPWFAGFCSVLTNVNDIAAMGGRPWAVVDVLFLGTGENERVLQGMTAASQALGVPVVGGHTTRVSGASMLAVSVVGRASRLIPSAGARPGHVLLAAISLQGSFRGQGGNFNAATAAPSHTLRAQLAVLPELAETGLVAAGKDVSMAGLCGTLLMMLEQSGAGAELDLARIPAPSGVDPLRWLTAFPSYGFLLATTPQDAPSVCARFDAVGVACAPVGRVDDSKVLSLTYEGKHEVYWDLERAALTGFGR